MKLIVGLMAGSSLLAACASSPSAPHTSSRVASPPAATSSAPEPWKVIVGNGTFQMGGADGKNWGKWSSAGLENGCQWSVRGVNPGVPGEILDSGTAAAGEAVQVDIEPTDAKRTVLMTSGCADWTWQPY